MTTIINYILAIIILILFADHILRSYISKDKSLLWSPISFICLYFTYYVIIPFFKGGEYSSEVGHTYLLLGTLLFYITYKATFYFSKPTFNFNKWNSLITEQNANKIAIILFLIAFVGYGIFRGFNLSILTYDSRDSIIFDEDASYGHTEMYITYLISMFTFSCALLYASKKKLNLLFFIFTLLSLAIYIIGGFRYRILILFLTLALVIYLYPQARKIRLHIILPLFLALYIFMGIMEDTRMYGKGLDKGALLELQETGAIEESSENIMVFDFSAECMAQYGVKDFFWFKPFINAVCSPIPRAIFPNKPKGLYMREANMKVLGTITNGCAFLNITEAYLSFGWIGILLYAFILGFISKLFWNNYRRNPTSLGAVVLLGLFNAVLYQIIARGYLAQTLTTFIYYVCIPFWLTTLLKKMKIIE